MGFNWSSDEAAEATNGKNTSTWKGKNVTIDSRKINPGDIFVALKGTKQDGHDHLSDAFSKGAAAAIVSRNDINISNPLLIVNDTLIALNDLGKYSRRHSKAKIIAVTGSVGKTSTKEALRIAFESQGETYASYGNFNNDIGVPLCLANMPKSTEYGIFEMGMNHQGEIAILTNQVKPDISIITTIEPVHLEFFANVEAIAHAKAEIFIGMSPGSHVIIYQDNPHFELLKKLAQQKSLNIVAFGEKEHADCRLISYEQNDEGALITANILGTKISYIIGSLGIHHARNSLAVLAAVVLSNGNLNKAADSLKNFANLKGRGKQHLLCINNKNILLIDDSYNASPASIKAALKVLGHAKKYSGRKIAILADMRELGENAIQLHKDLANDIISNKIDKVLTVGENMQHLYDILPEQVKLASYPDVDSLIPDIQKFINDNDTLLVKGSLGTSIYKLVDVLIK